MDCKKCMTLIDAALDGHMDEAMKIEFDRHIVSCPACARELEDRRLIRDLLAEEETLPLPEDFERTLHERLLAAEQEPTPIESGKKKTDRKPLMQRTWFKAAGAIAASFLVIAVVIGSMDGLRMGGASYESAVMEDQAVTAEAAPMAPEIMKSQDNMLRSGEMPAAEPAMEEAYGAEESLEDQGYRQDRLIIKNLHFNLDVLDFDEVFKGLEALVVERGGYVANANVYYKTYDPVEVDRSLKAGFMELKVPEAHLNEVIDRIRNDGVVKNEEISSYDVTDQYRDTVNRLENLEASERRLRELMEEATEVADVIEIERELARLRTDIDAMKGQVARWEKLADFATINVSLNEVQNYEDQIRPIDRTLGDRLKDALVGAVNRLIAGGENLLVAIAYNLPTLVILGLVGLVVIWIIKRKNRRNG